MTSVFFVFVLKKEMIVKKNDIKTHFFYNLFGQLKKKQYLCTRFRN